MKVRTRLSRTECVPPDGRASDQRWISRDSWAKPAHLLPENRLSLLQPFMHQRLPRWPPMRVRFSGWTSIPRRICKHRCCVHQQHPPQSHGTANPAPRPTTCVIFRRWAASVPTVATASSWSLIPSPIRLNREADRAPGRRTIVANSRSSECHQAERLATANQAPEPAVERRSYSV